ncbi:MAG: radical SAM protein [Clostridia bacterium]|nr:radical SAM protein [Clostridia bacterium]
MKKQIKQVHFQITQNCNLRCPFCGQWGKKGFFAESSGKAMTLSDWERVIAELETYRMNTGISTTVTVWGGEPLVSSYFDEIITALHQKSFKTEIITNGVLIDEHLKTIQNCVDRVYVSLDGTREVHNSIRGEGVFEKVTENLKKLKHNNVTVMSVITPQLINGLDEFLTELDSIGIKQLYLQDMIGFTADEIQEYKSWLNSVFDITAHDIDSWRNDNLFKAENIAFGNHGYEIEHKKHNKDGHCHSPFNHAHIAWNGNVLYCTDFYDFSAGNVKEDSLINIFNNEKSERYRAEIQAGNCPTCNHCSWRTKEEY